jgi:hypothetical protein
MSPNNGDFFDTAETTLLNPTFPVGCELLLSFFESTYALYALEILGIFYFTFHHFITLVMVLKQSGQ